ncbi:MAG: enoyl-CoA hydratase/isomerase family protein [Acidimicrobiia bacterium]
MVDRDTFLTIEDRGPVRWLTLDRRDRKNAVPAGGWARLGDEFRAFEASASRVLVVTGAGGDFCSGADLDMSDLDSEMTSTASNADRMRVTGAAALALHRVSKPTIAAVDGVAVGAGMNLALGCDIVVATERARFAEIFVKRGLTLDFGGTWLLPRLVGLAKARELALTARVVEAEEAEAIGLVARIVGVSDLESTVTELAERLAAGAPVAQRFTKVGLDRSSTMSFEQALQYEDQAQAVLLASEDFREGVAAFLGKRTPDFRGR